VHGIAGRSYTARRAAQKSLPLGPPTDLALLPKGEYPCPDCRRVFKYVQVLGKHRRDVHGVEGTSPAAIARKNKQPHEPLHEMNGKGNTHAHSGAIEPSRHAEVEQVQDKHINFGIPDSLVAATAGRFEELCRSVAYEYDVPPRMFAARVAGHVYSKALRELPGNAHRMPVL
jgi:hypothetical protein